MKTAIWIIAICEVIRAVQNAFQLRAMRSEKGMRENAYQEFVNSLKSTDREFVKKMLEEFMNQEDSE
jgi:FixJ family two-component response regulator